MFSEHILKHIEDKDEYIIQFVNKVCEFTHQLNTEVTRTNVLDNSDESIDTLINKLAYDLNLTVIYTDHYDEYPEIPGEIIPRTHDTELTDYNFIVLITTVVCDIQVINNYSLVLDLPKNMDAFVYAKNKNPYFIVSRIETNSDHSTNNTNKENKTIYKYDVNHYKFEGFAITEEIDLIDIANIKLVSNGYNEKYWESIYYFNT